MPTPEQSKLEQLISSIFKHLQQTKFDFSADDTKMSLSEIESRLQTAVDTISPETAPRAVALWTRVQHVFLGSVDAFFDNSDRLIAERAIITALLHHLNGTDDFLTPSELESTDKVLTEAVAEKAQFAVSKEDITWEHKERGDIPSLLFLIDKTSRLLSLNRFTAHIKVLKAMCIANDVETDNLEEFSLEVEKFTQAFFEKMTNLESSFFQLNLDQVDRNVSPDQLPTNYLRSTWAAILVFIDRMYDLAKKQYYFNVPINQPPFDSVIELLQQYPDQEWTATQLIRHNSTRADLRRINTEAIIYFQYLQRLLKDW